MDERAKFIAALVSGEWTMTDLCCAYGVSRKTGHKWWNRYRELGPAGLDDLSRAPDGHPNATSAEVVEVLVAARKKHPRWGPKKLVVWLRQRYPRLAIPAPSTAGRILRRQGLIRPRRVRHRAPPYASPFVDCTVPNAVWCADFKGGFSTGDGRRCNPLTVSDAYSRYLLVCEALGRTDESVVAPFFESAFCEFGLPTAMRTDNGPPFATVAVGGLSRLAIWWVKLGIIPERITPGKPTENGRHERIHLTLQQDTAEPPERSRRQQQRRFEVWQREYNDERPHEALGMQSPATLYRASPRRYPRPLREPEYDDGSEVRRVRSKGGLKWRGHELYLSETLAGEPVGLVESEDGDGSWEVFYGPLLLATVTSSGKLQRPRSR